MPKPLQAEPFSYFLTHFHFTPLCLLFCLYALPSVWKCLLSLLEQIFFLFKALHKV